MPLQDVCIELRPNLFSGRAVLCFDNDIKDICELTLSIRERDMQLVEVDKNYKKNVYVVSYGSYGINTKMLHGSSIAHRHIHFRFCFTDFDHVALQGVSNFKSEPVPPPVQLTLRENLDRLTLHCNNCQIKLVNSVMFDRLREFPNGLVDVSDFFCHSHSHSHGNNNNDMTTVTLVPKPKDLFYGINFIVINIKLLIGTVRNNSEHMCCKRCLNMLGVLILDGGAVKVWSDAIYWLPERKVFPTPIPTPLFANATISSMMMRILHTFWPQSQPINPTQSRAILSSIQPNRDTQYMLIQVLDQRLSMMRLKPGTIKFESSLRHCYACKLYFRVYEVGNMSKSKSKQWMQSVEDLPKLEISPNLFNEIQSRLTTNARLVPRPDQYNSSEEQLRLTYFFFENEEEEQHRLLQTAINTSSDDHEFDEIESESEYESTD